MLTVRPGTASDPEVMMAAYLTNDPRFVLMNGFDHAIRLGHHYLGGEHFLLALAGSDEPAGVVLREQGVTPERVEAEIVRLSGAGLFGDLDRSALATLGIDVDAVRTGVEARFGQAALGQADQALRRAPGAWNPRRRKGAERDGVFLPHGPGVDEILRHAIREPEAGHATRPTNAIRPTTEGLALSLLAASEGLVPAILSALGVSVPAVRAAILDRYQQPS
jgi:hypothetical protein